jgi:hypothetical protein
MEPVEGVALLAVLLREAGRNRHVAPECIEDDMDCQVNTLSMASLLAHERFGPLEWRLAELLHEQPEHAVEIARRLCVEEQDELASEVLLHANGKRTRAQWAEPFRARWPQVRASMAAFEREGITINFTDLDQIANDAYQAATGATTDEVHEQFYDSQWQAEADAAYAEV